MGDMAEIFNDMKEYKKQKRKARFESASEAGWSKHTDYHWYRDIAGKRLNYWPSSGLVMIGKKRHNIKGKFIRGLIDRESALRAPKGE